jgi:hypothetical protein
VVGPLTSASAAAELAVASSKAASAIPCTAFVGLAVLSTIVVADKAVLGPEGARAHAPIENPSIGPFQINLLI